MLARAERSRRGYFLRARASEVLPFFSDAAVSLANELELAATVDGLARACAAVRACGIYMNSPWLARAHRWRDSRDCGPIERRGCASRYSLLLFSVPLRALQRPALASSDGNCSAQAPEHVYCFLFSLRSALRIRRDFIRSPCVDVQIERTEQCQGGCASKVTHE